MHDDLPFDIFAHQIAQARRHLNDHAKILDALATLGVPVDSTYTVHVRMLCRDLASTEHVFNRYARGERPLPLEST